MRIDEFLTDQHVPFEIMLHPPAYTAQNRAKFLHVPGRQVAKCVLLAGSNQHVLAVVPATHLVDLEAVARVLGAPFHLAHRDDLDLLFPDCETGALPPFGRLYGLTTILDDSLNPNTWIIFEAQRHALAIRMGCGDFERLEKPLRFAFAHHQPLLGNRAC